MILARHVGAAVMAAGAAFGLGQVAAARETARIPAPFIGVWDSGPKPCNQDAVNRANVSKDEIRFYEDSADVQSVKPLAEGRIQVVVKLDVDGDEQGKYAHDATLIMTLSPNHTALTISGFPPKAMHLKRCPAH